MQTRVRDFLDTNTFTAFYSFQCKIGGKWNFMIDENNKPLIFNDSVERDKVQVTYRKMKESDLTNAVKDV